jgi:hypothetical protein
MERKTPQRTNPVNRREEGTEEEIKRKERRKKCGNREKPGVYETGRRKKILDKQLDTTGYRSFKTDRRQVLGIDRLK